MTNIRKIKEKGQVQKLNEAANCEKRNFNLEIKNNMKFEGEKEKQKMNYDTFAMNKSIETNNFFKNEDLYAPFTYKLNEIYPKILRNSANKEISLLSKIKNKDARPNEMLKPISNLVFFKF